MGTVDRVHDHKVGAKKDALQAKTLHRLSKYAFRTSRIMRTSPNLTVLANNRQMMILRFAERCNPDFAQTAYGVSRADNTTLSS